MSRFKTPPIDTTDVTNPVNTLQEIEILKQQISKKTLVVEKLENKKKAREEKSLVAENNASKLEKEK